MGRRLTIGLAVLAAMPLLYVGAYCALLDPVEPLVSFVHFHRAQIRIPGYRIGGDSVERLFAPLNAVDQKLRPTFWVEEIDWEEVEIDEPDNID